MTRVRRPSRLPFIPPTMPRLVRLLPTALLLAAPPVSHAQAPDVEGVRRAALDYLEGFYEGDSTKHIRSIHPSVFKHGYSRSRTGTYSPSNMKWPEEFHAFTRGVRTSGRGGPPPNAPKEVQVFEVLDQTASAKVTAWWGIDYLLMAKVDGAWRITHILWQSPPPKAATP